MEGANKATKVGWCYPFIYASSVSPPLSVPFVSSQCSLTPRPPPPMSHIFFCCLWIHSMLRDVCVAAQWVATRGACLPLSPSYPLPFAITHTAIDGKYNYGAIVCKQGKDSRQAGRQTDGYPLWHWHCNFFPFHLLLEPWAMGLHSMGIRQNPTR